MPGRYTINIQYYPDGKDIPETIVIDENNIKQVKTIMDLGFRHKDQINLLQKIQDQIIKLQTIDLQEDIDSCPNCGNSLQRRGYIKSEFHAVFTDHKVPVRRLQCNHCNYKSIPSITSLFGTAIHPDLAKIQCETGAVHSYRRSQEILNLKACGKRKVNNHVSINNVIDKVGNYISTHVEDDAITPLTKAKYLIVQADGGHVKDKAVGKRSFEVMASIVYRPESIEYSQKDERGNIISKHCAASAKNDNQKHIKQATLIAAQKQGLTKNTKVTALCDGAKNCWTIIDVLKPHCKKVDKILDWFHIAMKIENISLPEEYKEKLKKIKWHLWHGGVEPALKKLNLLITELPVTYQSRVNEFKKYIENNKDKIVNYSKRKKTGLVFTSQMAESTVESLINQRCKGKQHMTWTRGGIHPLLQVIAYVASNDWVNNWEDKIMGATAKAA